MTSRSRNFFNKLLLRFLLFSPWNIRLINNSKTFINAKNSDIPRTTKQHYYCLIYKQKKSAELSCLWLTYRVGLLKSIVWTTKLVRCFTHILIMWTHCNVILRPEFSKVTYLFRRRQHRKQIRMMMRVENSTTEPIRMTLSSTWPMVSRDSQCQRLCQHTHTQTQIRRAITSKCWIHVYSSISNYCLFP